MQHLECLNVKPCGTFSNNWTVSVYATVSFNKRFSAKFQWKFPRRTWKSLSIFSLQAGQISRPHFQQLFLRELKVFYLDVFVFRKPVG